MALLHGGASITPSKLEMLDAWVPTQDWYVGRPDPAFCLVGAFRFDDPGGVVGMETHLVRDGDGPILQVPVTYRPAPLAGAEASLVTTMEHSVLGSRWVYDGLADPVFRTALATAILTGGSEAAQVRELADGRTEVVPAGVTVVGSGSPGAVVVPVDLTVVRILDDTVTAGDHLLAGTWAGHDEPAVLAMASVVP